MSKEEVIRYIDNISYLESAKTVIKHKIESVKMGDLTICSIGGILTPEDQSKLLFQEWQTLNQAASKFEDLLNCLSNEELTEAYIALMSDKASPLREARLNSLAILLGRTKEEEIKR